MWYILGVLFGLAIYFGQVWVGPKYSQTVGSVAAAPVQKAPYPPRSIQEIVSDGLIVCGTNLSVGREAILVEQIARISSKYLETPEHIDSFVGLLCIESKYDSSVKSSAGAVGIAQIMPQYAQGFADSCGLGQLAPQDLTDTETNLTLGACHFSKLLNQFDGNIALALSGYNSGQNSSTTKRLEKLVGGHPETMGYVAKFYTYLQKLEASRKEK